MTFFAYPEDRAKITHMSRAAWAVNRAGILIATVGFALLLITFTLPYGIQMPFGFAAGMTAFAGVLVWFFAGSPVS